MIVPYPNPTAAPAGDLLRMGNGLVLAVMMWALTFLGSVRSRQRKLAVRRSASA